MTGGIRSHSPTILGYLGCQGFDSSPHWDLRKKIGDFNGFKQETHGFRGGTRGFQQEHLDLSIHTLAIYL
jgi:hypothetical protein